MKVMLVKNIFEDEDVFIEMFKSLFKNIRVEEIDEFLAIYFTYDNNDDIIHILNALETELVGTIHAYISEERTEGKLTKEIGIMIPMLRSLPNGIYFLKDALLRMKLISNKKEVLSFILDGTGVNEDFIREFAENDLNVSQASKQMFIHRNTLIYKLNKLKANAGFDLTNFKDAYILYSLLEMK